VVLRAKISSFGFGKGVDREGGIKGKEKCSKIIFMLLISLCLMTNSYRDTVILFFFSTISYKKFSTTNDKILGDPKLLKKVLERGKGKKCAGLKNIFESRAIVSLVSFIKCSKSFLLYCS
jgi:hypothetical protein